MIEASLIRFLNTHGVFLLVVFILFYEAIVVKNREVVWHVLFSVVATLIFCIVLKELFQIPRPYVTSGEDALAGLTYFSSLPSAHTAVAFVLATTVTLHQKTLGVFLFTLAALIGMGRVLANVHAPIDIILGLLIGVLTGVIFNQIHLSRRRK